MQSVMVSYMETLVSEFKTRRRGNVWPLKTRGRPYEVMSQPTDDDLIYKGQVFGSKEDVVHAVKTSLLDRTNNIVYKSSKTLLKLKCKREIECARSLLAIKWTRL